MTTNERNSTESRSAQMIFVEDVQCSIFSKVIFGELEKCLQLELIRLSLAANVLHGNKRVTRACVLVTNVQFENMIHFIALFRESLPRDSQSFAVTSCLCERKWSENYAQLLCYVSVCLRNELVRRIKYLNRSNS